MDITNFQHYFFSDGGVQAPVNLSRFGCYCVRHTSDFAGNEFKNTGLVKEYTGQVIPGDLGWHRVTNNNTELLGLMTAAEKALPYLERGERVLFVCDSLFAIGTLFLKYRYDTVPKSLVPDMLNLRRKYEGLPGKYWDWLNIAGHPAPSELEAGISVRKNKSGENFLVSWNNVHCDTQCNLMKKRYLSSG